MTGVKERVSLNHILINAKDGVWRSWQRDDKEGFLTLPDEYHVLANAEALINAFGALFYVLRGKCPDGSSVNVSIESDWDNCYVVCTIFGVEPEWHL